MLNMKNVRTGDRVIFYDRYEKEGVVLELSPSQTRVKIEYSLERRYWFKVICIREILAPLPKKKRRFS